MKFTKDLIDDIPEPKKKRSLLLLVLLLSFLLHFLILLILFWVPIQKHIKSFAQLFDEKVDQRQKDQIKSALQKMREALQGQDQSSAQARLKMRKSTFGTHVFFEEAPKVTPTEIPHHLDHDPFEKPEEEKKEKEQEHKKTVTEQLPVQEKKVEIPTQPKKEKTVRTTKLKNKQESLIKEQVSTRVVPQKETFHVPEEAEKQENKVEKEEVILSMTPQQQITPDDDVAVIKKQAPKKKNILTMTKGFIDTLGRGSDDGNSYFDRAGDENKKPSFEELQFISYQQKIYWQLQSAWNRTFKHNYNKSITHDISATLDYTIDQKGNLVDVVVVRSSGDKEVDFMLKETMRLAAPFPPIPKHLNLKIYRRVEAFSIVTNRSSFKLY